MTFSIGDKVSFEHWINPYTYHGVVVELSHVDNELYLGVKAVDTNGNVIGVYYPDAKRCLKE